MTDFLEKLEGIILARKRQLDQRSYTARLFVAGEDEIIKKVGEESVEVMLAAKGQSSERLVSEVADLVYHTLVLLASQEVSLSDVASELERRHVTLHPGEQESDDNSDAI